MRDGLQIQWPPPINYTPVNLTFFTDADLPGQRIADAIALSSGAHVEQHNSHFGRRTEDVDWLPYVGQRNWVVVTADKRIKRRFFERETLINAGVRAFVLGNGNWGVQAIIAILTAAMPAMLKLIAEQSPPFIARISQTGDIELLHPLRQTRPVKPSPA